MEQNLKNKMTTAAFTAFGILIASMIIWLGGTTAEHSSTLAKMEVKVEGIKEVKEDIKKIEGNIDELQKDVVELKIDFAGVKSEVATVKNEVADVREEMNARFDKIERLLGERGS